MVCKLNLCSSRLWRTGGVYILPDIKRRVFILPVDNLLRSKSYRTISNAEMRRINGNGRSKGIKIAHWNKGNSLLVNKIQEIKTIMLAEKPHIIGLSEANFLDRDDKQLVSIDEYNFHICKTINNPKLKISRVVVYTHVDIIAKLRPDLMSDEFSSIWLEVGLPNQKKVLVCQVYREG